NPPAGSGADPKPAGGLGHSFTSWLCGSLSFDDVRLRALYEGDDLVALSRRNLESLQRGVEVSQERRPIALADLHPLVGNLHSSTGVIESAAGAGAQIVYQELLLAPHGICASVLAELGQPRIGLQARQPALDYRGCGVIT